MFGIPLSPKSIAVIGLGLLIGCLFTLTITYKMKYNSASAVVKQQSTTIIDQASQIDSYKKNIELAKAHEERVANIEKKSAPVRRTIQKIKIVRDLTDEEKEVASNITDLVNGVYNKSSDSKTSGEVLSKPNKDDPDATKDNP
jgi:hypothetical protein